MPSNNTRQRRVAQLIQEELSLILRSDVDDPHLQKALITAVRVSADLSHAKIYLSDITDNADACLTAAKKAAKFLRFQLAQRIDLRAMPELSFKIDTSLTHGNQLSKLIDDVCLEDEKNRNQQENEDSNS